MLDKLIKEYEEKYGLIELPTFLDLNEDEQEKILKECLDGNIEIYENEYFNDNYMEIVE